MESARPVVGQDHYEETMMTKCGSNQNINEHDRRKYELKNQITGCV
jgi:hypothetical protein